ncbi:hypothetical protein RND71_028466 [Anisodus tanguticus]|uniref:Uncharacterized protein n=1 Tax=Anisodus tanguticus TaxID=243964 RepID=A0AAE1RJP9_9SOLA|nr:hypothetical protein RND71_028466 [Anisodus tanguticus]
MDCPHSEFQSSISNLPITRRSKKGEGCQGEVEISGDPKITAKGSPTIGRGGVENNNLHQEKGKGAKHDANGKNDTTQNSSSPSDYPHHSTNRYPKATNLLVGDDTTQSMSHSKIQSEVDSGDPTYTRPSISSPGRIERAEQGLVNYINTIWSATLLQAQPNLSYLAMTLE